MSSVSNWMPIYWGDYHRDTGHLLAAEHGAYLLLIGHIWSTQRPLPDHDGRLATIARMTSEEWAQARLVLQPFFVVEAGFWRHGRVEREIKRAVENAERAQERTEAARQALRKKREAAKPKPNSSDCNNDCHSGPDRDSNNVPRAGGDGVGVPYRGNSSVNSVAETDPSWESAA